MNEEKKFQITWYWVMSIAIGLMIIEWSMK